MQEEVISCPCFNSNIQNCGAAPTSGAVSIFFPCTMWFLEVAHFFCLKVLRAGRKNKRERTESFFFSFQFESAQPVIWPEINMWATFPLGLQRPDFNILALPSPLKGIQVIGSIFLTPNDCLTKLGATQSTCTSGGFSGASIINKRQTSRMRGKACLRQFLSGVRKCIHIDSKHNIYAISPIHICLLTERCQKASHEDNEDQRSE